MKIAIMQPYFFPYIGYWQLIHAVDRFVILDDVSYINRGWINRNRILINGNPTYITLPLHRASQNKKICEMQISTHTNWQDKLLRTIETTYRKSPHFPEVFPVIEDIIRYETSQLTDYLANQLQQIASFISIDTELVLTSRKYSTDHLAGQERIIDICRQENATHYINPQGGQDLYDKQAFNRMHIDLSFLTMKPLPYKQRNGQFIPYLSIIDVLMEVGAAEFKTHLESYALS